MNSHEMKTKVLHYFRFRKLFLYIATEAGRWASDVLVGNDKEIIEIETKITLADFRQDFKKKKHEIFQNPSAYYKALIPTKFYFCIPESLASEVKSSLIKSPYGILVCLPGEITRKGSFIKVIKKAENLREGISKKLLRALILRMGSEMIRARIKEL